MEKESKRKSKREREKKKQPNYKGFLGIAVIRND
jgi:hypothetical protein